MSVEHLDYFRYYYYAYEAGQFHKLRSGTPQTDLLEACRQMQQLLRLIERLPGTTWKSQLSAFG
jgi:hypothetical protein